jgi:hypothetical protein
MMTPQVFVIRVLLQYWLWWWGGGGQWWYGIYWGCYWQYDFQEINFLPYKPTRPVSSNIYRPTINSTGLNLKTTLMTINSNHQNSKHDGVPNIMWTCVALWFEVWQIIITIFTLSCFSLWLSVSIYVRAIFAFPSFLYIHVVGPLSKLTKLL